MTRQFSFHHIVYISGFCGPMEFGDVDDATVRSWAYPLFDAACGWLTSMDWG